MNTQNQDTKSIVSLVCGIIGILAVIICRFLDNLTLVSILYVVALALGIVSIIFGVQARKEAPENAKGMATGGMVCGIVATVLSALSIVSCVACVGCVACAACSIASSAVQ